MQVSFLSMLLPSSIPFASCGWLQAKSNSILGLFEYHFACLCLFHKILRTIQDEIKQAFCLPLDRIAWDPTNELTWFLFLLLPRWCLRYIQKGRLGLWEVSVHLQMFMANNWSSLREESSCASCALCFHHSWEDSSTICFRQCLILRRASEYSHTSKTLQPMTPTIPSEDTVVALRHTPPSFRPCPFTYFWLSARTHFCPG